MLKLYGNINSLIDCDFLIKQCMTHTVETYVGHMEQPKDSLYYDEYIKQHTAALEAGYNESVEFRHYYPVLHFSESVTKEFEKFTNTKHLLSFVSEIRPGKCAPWHSDINPWLDDYPNGEFVRYVCFIDKPKHGQAFMIEDTCFYLEEQGNVYQYPSLDSFHAGFNAGLETKFLYTYTGIL